MIHDIRLSETRKTGTRGEAIRVFYREGLGFGVLAKKLKPDTRQSYAQVDFEREDLMPTGALDDIKLEGKIWEKYNFDIDDEREATRLAVIGVNQAVRQRRQQTAVGQLHRPDLEFNSFPMQ